MQWSKEKQNKEGQKKHAHHCGTEYAVDLKKYKKQNKTNYNTIAFLPSPILYSLLAELYRSGHFTAGSGLKLGSPKYLLKSAVLLEAIKPLSNHCWAESCIWQCQQCPHVSCTKERQERLLFCLGWMHWFRDGRDHWRKIITQYFLVPVAGSSD